MTVRSLAALALTTPLALLACSSSNGDDPPIPETCANIQGSLDVDGLSIRKPEADPIGCKEIDNPTGGNPKRICERKTADFSCVGVQEPLGTPVMVTVRGCVESFGIESTSYDLVISMFREFAADGTTPVDPGYDVKGQPGMQADKSPAALVARSKSTRVPIERCRDEGAFEIANVPTETPMVIRVTQQDEPAASRDYVDTYQYNFMLRNREIVDQAGMPVNDPQTRCGMAGVTCYVDETMNTVRDATFTVVARAAGVSVITGQDNLWDDNGQGHIAGEIRDCGSEDPVQNAVVAVGATARKAAYFNTGFGAGAFNIEDPKPEGTRTRTNADGLYGAIGIDTQPGGKPVKIGAAITQHVCGLDNVCRCTEDNKPNPAWSAPDMSEGEATLLGTRTVYVFPDSITIMTFDRNTYTRR